MIQPQRFNPSLSIECKIAFSFFLTHSLLVLLSWKLHSAIGKWRMKRKNLVNHRENVNNIFHSHHHKYIDTFSIKFNYPRRNICVRMMKEKGEWERQRQRLNLSIYLFEYLTRSTNILSQLANQMFLTKIWGSLLLLRRFFSSLLISRSVIYKEQECSFIMNFIIAEHFSFLRLSRSQQKPEKKTRSSLKNCRNFGARKKRTQENS